MSPLRLPLRLSARLSGNTSVTTIGAVFEDQQNGNGTFRFMPQNGQEGTYAIIFSATDNREIITQTSVKIEVCYAPPLSLPMDGVAIMSGKLFRIGIFTPKDIGLSAQLLNNDGSFSPLSNIGASFYFVGLGFTEKLMEFGWTPTEAQAGLYKIMFQANNRAGDLTQKIMQIRVLPSQLLSPIPSQKAEVGQWYKYKLVIPFPTNSDSNYINSVRLSAEWERGKVGLEGNPYLTSGHLVHYNNEAFTPALEWEFGWQPGREDLGGYHFRFTASSS
jgi:hypothetical protein